MSLRRSTFEYLGSGGNPWIKGGLAAAVVAAYILAFLPPFGLENASILHLAATPIVVCAWLFGFWGGTLAAIVIIPLNAFLFSLASDQTVAEIIRTQDALPAVLLLVLGAVLGGLRDVAEQMRRDFAERTEIEEARQESEERYRFVAESASDGILTIDQERRILFANRAAEKIFGVPITELVGRPFADLIPAHIRTEQDATLARYLEAVVTSTPDHALQIAGRGKGGRTVTLEISFGEYVKDQRHIFTGVVRDVTERAQLESVLKEAKEDAEQASRAKSEFLSRLAHELRTPLNAILGFGQLLDMEELEPDQKENVDQILRSGRHLLTLVDEVLDIARIESGRLLLSPGPVEVHQVITEAWDLVRYDAARSGITLHNGGHGGQDHVVVADRQRLKQVLLHLLSNAIKYNVADGQVRISCSPGLDRPGSLRISVTDTGRGISREALSQLFTPFERLGAEHSGIEGTGMGLAVSRGLVEAMGGGMGVESRQGVGSTFWVELPLDRAHTYPDLPAFRVEPGGRGGDGGRGTTVLTVVEDPESRRKVERAFRARAGDRLLTAAGGLEGLELARQERPDLILVDLHLADVHGSEMLRRIREDPVISRTPVVMLGTDPEAVQRLLDAGAQACLAKPLDPASLARTLEEALTF